MQPFLRVIVQNYVSLIIESLQTFEIVLVLLSRSILMVDFEFTLKRIKTSKQ